MADASQRPVPKGRFDNPLVYLAAVAALLLVGGGVFAYLRWTRPQQRGEPPKSIGRLVRVCRVEKTSHRIAVTAYGTTRASRQWTAIAEVRGRAVQVEERFEPGELLPAGTLLVSIDPTDYELAVKRLKAEVLAKQLALIELDQTEANLKLLLEPQDRQLDLAEAEYGRQKEAFAQGAVSRSVLEAASSAYETSLTAILQTQNSLALLPVRRSLTQASLDATAAQLEQARRDLSECKIVLPLAARCASKSIEQNQYATAGEQLGTFLALDATEVVAMFETRKMPLIFPEEIRDMEVLDLTQLTGDESFWKQVRIPVEVSWALGRRRPVWHGRVTRIASSLDPGTRTVPVIVEIRDPYKNVKPGVRPPLIPDVFCRVTAYGARVDDVVVIPREALHDDRVYLLQKDGTLHVAAVEVVALEDELAVIKEGAVQTGRGRRGIRSGDLLVLADLFPASEGMPLRGKLVENLVKPRTAIDVPESVFDEPDDGSPDVPATSEPAEATP